MPRFSSLALLRREIHAVRDVLSRLREYEPSDELLRAVRERLGVAIQYAGQVNRRYASTLEEARRALWIASRSRAPRARIEQTQALVAKVLESVRQDTVE